jgi:hypothetical protein
VAFQPFCGPQTITRHNNPAQQPCTATLHNNHAQTPCTTTLHSNRAQQTCTKPCTATMHSNPAQQSCTATLHNNCAQQPCTTTPHKTNIFHKLNPPFLHPQHHLLPRPNEDEIDGSPFFLLTKDFEGLRVPTREVSLSLLSADSQQRSYTRNSDSSVSCPCP